MDKFDTIIAKSKNDVAVDASFVDSVMSRIHMEQAVQNNKPKFRFLSMPLLAGFASLLLVFVAGIGLVFGSHTTSSKSSPNSLSGTSVSTLSGQSIKPITPQPTTSNTPASVPASAVAPVSTADLTNAVSSIDASISQSAQDISNSVGALNDQPISIPTN